MLYEAALRRCVKAAGNAKFYIFNNVPRHYLLVKKSANFNNLCGFPSGCEVSFFRLEVPKMLQLSSWNRKKKLSLASGRLLILLEIRGSTLELNLCST